MTVIVAVSDAYRVCMASDSQMSTGNGGKGQRPFGKMVRVGRVLIGAEGSLATQTALRYHAKSIPVSGDTGPLDAWVAEALAPWLRAWLKERDLLEDERGIKRFPGQLLVARGPEIVLLDGEGSPARFATNWWAIGSGGPEARGALHVLSSRLKIAETEDAAREAVDAAIALDDGCGGKTHVEWTEE